jgi:2-amino-4-hydroxy-6-hydroxymethyldihydropteridine diphosphokinase
VAVIHAHGDNSDAIMENIDMFTGPVMITTQSTPDLLLCNFGGFTDGDRAVCLARHFGARRINLVGFDFDNPSCKEGSDPAVKKKKLSWAKHIIFDMNPPGVELKSI